MLRIRDQSLAQASEAILCHAASHSGPALEPETFTDYTDQAYAAFIDGDYAEASALSNVEDKPHRHNNTGAALFMQGYSSSAMMHYSASFDQYAAQKPRSLYAEGVLLYNAGLAALESNASQAQRLFERAARVFPRSAIVWLRIAEACIAQLGNRDVVSWHSVYSNGAQATLGSVDSNSAASVGLAAALKCTKLDAEQLRISALLKAVYLALESSNPALALSLCEQLEDEQLTPSERQLYAGYTVEASLLMGVALPQKLVAELHPVDRVAVQLHETTELATVVQVPSWSEPDDEQHVLSERARVATRLGIYLRQRSGTGSTSQNYTLLRALEKMTH